MFLQTRQRITVDEFEAWVDEQIQDYEYIGGEALPVVANNYSSQIAARILTYIGMYLMTHDIGYVTGADGGYRVRGERYIPDVGFISKARQPTPSHDSYNPLPPELVVEVVSLTDKEKPLLVKLSNYLAEGTIVWIVYPDTQQVHVHQAGKGAQIIDSSGTLTASVLPGFTLAVRDIFR